MAYNPTDVEFDEFCDPNNPRTIKFEDIEAAARRIQGGIIKTPCARAHMSEQLKMELYLKLETLQFTGSFKERGVRNTLMMLSDEQKSLGVISASTGNHGIAMSYHSSQLGIPCIISMPLTSALIKKARCKSFGAKVIQHGASIREAKTKAMHIRKEKRLLYVSGYDHPNVIEGQGTAGIEIIEQLPDVDAVLVPVGGGSLLTGVLIAIKNLKPDTEVYAVETERTCSMCESLKKGERVNIDITNTIAEALATFKPGVNTFHNVRGLVDKAIAVKEDWVARAVMHLAQDEKYIVEGGAAVCVAALMAGLCPNLKGKKVVCIISGANIDSSVFFRCVERAMTLEGSLVEFTVKMFDRPGGLTEMALLLAGINVIIRDCVPQRPWVKNDVFMKEVRFIVETKGWSHTKQLVDLIKTHYNDACFHDEKIRPDKTVGNLRGPCLAPKPVCMQKN